MIFELLAASTLCGFSFGLPKCKEPLQRLDNAPLLFAWSPLDVIEGIHMCNPATGAGCGDVWTPGEIHMCNPVTGAGCGEQQEPKFGGRTAIQRPADGGKYIFLRNFCRYPTEVVLLYNDMQGNWVVGETGSVKTSISANTISHVWFVHPDSGVMLSAATTQNPNIAYYAIAPNSPGPIVWQGNYPRDHRSGSRYMMRLGTLKLGTTDYLLDLTCD